MSSCCLARVRSPVFFFFFLNPGWCNVLKITQFYKDVRRGRQFSYRGSIFCCCEGKDAVHWAAIIAQQHKIEEKTLIVQKLQVPTAQKRWGGVGRWVKGGADREVEKAQMIWKTPQVKGVGVLRGDSFLFFFMIFPSFSRELPLFQTGLPPYSRKLKCQNNELRVQTHQIHLAPVWETWELVRWRKASISHWCPQLTVWCAMGTLSIYFLSVTDADISRKTNKNSISSTKMMAQQNKEK